MFSSYLLSIVFAVVVVLAAYFMLRPLPEQPAESSRSCQSRFRWRRELGDEVYFVNLLVAFPVSFVAGLISGLIGVGGGLLKVPMMVLLFGVPMDIAVGSSAFMVGVTAAGGFVGHAAQGHWDWRTSLILATTVFIGGQIGSRISIRVNRQKLRKGFGLFLVVVAVFMLARVL